jgi:hypothetical protein
MIAASRRPIGCDFGRGGDQPLEVRFLGDDHRRLGDLKAEQSGSRIDIEFALLGEPAVERPGSP